jgi:riboflavin kinase, archaea type
MMILTGIVQSGENNFSYWLSKLEPYYTAKTGMRLFPGTLNIHLNEVYELPSETLCLRKEEHGGEVSVKIMPCRIFGRKAFILRPYRDNVEDSYDKRVLEIATDIKLRDAYHLEDGDVVQIEVQTGDAGHL